MLSRNDIKAIARLQQKKYRIEEGRIVAEGARFVIEALKSDWQLEMIIRTRDFKGSFLEQKILDTARTRNIPVHEVSKLDFKRISDTVHAQGILAVIRTREPERTPDELMRDLPRCLMIAVERLQDPGNLGTIIRTASWFGADALIVGPDCVDWSNPKALRASMGAVFGMRIYEMDDFVGVLQDLKRRGAVVYAAENQGEFPYHSLRYAPRSVLLIGEEVQGISEAAQREADHSVVIPRRGAGESLNAAIATAILIAEMTRAG